jgi:hypothetical protein
LGGFETLFRDAILNCDFVVRFCSAVLKCDFKMRFWNGVWVWKFLNVIFSDVVIFKGDGND